MLHLVNGDCLSSLADLAPASVDLVLADLPFGTTACRWDQVIPFADLWPALYRVAKPSAAMVMFAAQPFTSLMVTSNLRHFRYSLVYEKTMATGILNAKKMPLRAHEDIMIFYRRLPTFRPEMTKGERKTVRGSGSGSEVYSKKFYKDRDYDSDQRYPRSVSKVVSEPKWRKVHPTQKPVSLLRNLIRTYSNPGAVVLDPTMGSGSTGVAAVEEGRGFVGIERDERYFGIAGDRIASVFPDSVAIPVV